MKAKHHSLAGALSFIVLLSILKFIGITLSYPLLIFSFGSCLFGALIPDIDMKRSRIHRNFFYFSFLLLLAFFINSRKFVEIIFCINVLLLLLLFRKKVRHRKFFHSMKFGVLTALFIGIFSSSFLNSFIPAFFFFSGFFSHLILDKKV